MPSAWSQALHAANLPRRCRTVTSCAKARTAEVIGPIMVENRIEVHEMASSTESLESLFFELTGGEGMHPGHGAGLMGDYGKPSDRGSHRSLSPPTAGPTGDPS